MNEPTPLQPAPPRSSPQNLRVSRLQAIFEVLLLSGIVSSFVAAFPFYRKLSSAGFEFNNVYIVCAYVLLEALITLILLSWVLGAHRQKFEYLGLRRDGCKPDLLIGLALVPVLFLINGLMSAVVQTYLPKHFSNHNPLLEIIHTRRELVLFIIAAITAGGIKEELQRAFILTRFRDYLGGARMGLLLWSFVFGAAHYIQGLQGIITAGVFGFLFGAVYLARQNLTAPMVAHGVYDTLALLGYWAFRGAGH